MSFTQKSDFFWVDGSNNLFVIPNQPIANFPYVQKIVTTKNNNTGSIRLWVDPNFPSGGQQGLYTANQSDMTGGFGQYGPQSWKVGGDTTAVFYEQRNYSGRSKIYGPGSSESNTFAVNGAPFLSVAISTTTTVQSNMQQIGTFDSVSGTNQFWTFQQIQDNMTSLVYTAQASNPTTYTGAVVTKLIATINTMSCTNFIPYTSPILPSSICTASSTTTVAPGTGTTTTKRTTTTTAKPAGSSSSSFNYIYIALVVIILLIIAFLVKRLRSKNLAGSGRLGSSLNQGR